jgi:cytochrome P450
MSSNIAKASLLDNVRYNVFHVIPYLLRGVFTRNRRWVRWLTKIQRDPASVQFLGRLREKYRCDFLALRMLTDRTLLVFDGGAIRHILDHSPDIYAETKGKRRGMSHFQPNALTISRGEEWKDRRKFNTAVLKPGRGVHPLGQHFLSLIRKEIDQHSTPEKTALHDWDEFARLFESITLQILFGEGEKDFTLTGTLKQMMLEANNVILAGRKSKYFDGFYRKIAAHLESPPDHCLARLCRQTPSTEITQIENQIPHWLFAMSDTLAINTAAALALICAHPDAEKRVRSEIARYRPIAAENIDQMTYLEGCIQEAMRLWPSTPMLMREALVDDRIGDTPIPAGTQILIHNGFNHRDSKTHDFADRFQPEFWIGRPVDYRFNHFSNGAQVCAGKDLALFVAKAVLATLLDKNRFTVQRPLLMPEWPLPYTFDHFSIKWTRTSISEV